MLNFVRSKGFREFLPFLVLVVGGSIYLREFTNLRYKYRSNTSYDIKQDMEKMGITFKPTTLEMEYEKLKEVDIENWENVRIPRKWEEPNNEKN